MQIAHRVKRNRFQKHHQPLLLARQPHAGPQHPRRIGPVRGAGENQPRNVAQHRHRVVVVEMPAKALLIAQPGDAQHHRVGVLPLREKRQGRRLAPDLIFGVVQIGQKLNLGQRDKTVLRHADGQAENRLLVEQRVDHSVRPEARLQLLRHPINPALAPDILAHHHDFRVRQHQVGQRPVEQAAHRLRLVQLAQIAAKRRRARLGRGAVGGRTGARRRDQAGHHISRGFQPWPSDRLGRDPGHAGGGVVVNRQRIGGCQRPGLVELPHHVQQGVVGLIRLDFLARKVGGRHIGPGVAVKPDHAQMQEGGRPVVAHVMRGLGRHGKGLVDVEPVSGEVTQSGPGRKPRRDPAARGLGGNPDAIVFADKQQRQRDRLIRGPARGVEGPLRGRMVGRSIAETGHDDRVIGQDAVLGRAAPRRANGIGRPHRLGQVAGDGRGLRRNHQRP